MVMHWIAEERGKSEIWRFVECTSEVPAYGEVTVRFYAAPGLSAR